MKRGLWRRKSSAAEVVGRGDGAGQEAAPERGVGHQADAELAQDRQDLVLDVPGPQRVLGLQGGDRVHGVRPADGVGRRLGQPEVPDLAGGDQLGHRADGLLDRHRLVDPVLVVEVDVVDAEPLQAGVAGRADVRRAAVDAGSCGRRRRRTLPNLVASTTSSRRPAMARPTSSSLVNGPYMSAVSRRVTPRSRARWMVATASASSARAVELRHAHAAEAEGGDLGERGAEAGAEGGLVGGGIRRGQLTLRLRARSKSSPLAGPTAARAGPRRCRSCG